MSGNHGLEPERSWGDRPLLRRDLLLLVGLVSVAVVAAAGIIVYALLYPFSDEAREGQRAAGVAGSVPEETAVEAPRFPALAVLPAFECPEDNPCTPEKVELGKMLFFDARMSGDGSMACNSCHPGGDGSWSVASPIAFGYPGTLHWRNAMTLINVAYFSKLDWDGAALGLEAQATGAWTGAVAGNLDTAMAEELLAQIPEYVERFRDVFGTDYPTFREALLAVAAFERTLLSQNVPFDAYLNGDEDAISEEAKAGFALFTGKANCIACHNGPLISDDSFHNTGVPTAPQFTDNAFNQITFRFQHWSRGMPEEIYNTSTEDKGLFYITKREEDIGKFRTQGLRYICYTAPYMHNGVFATLEEVVAFYNDGGGDHPNKDPVLRPLNLTESEQSALVTFLQSLCGDKLVIEKPELPDYAPWPLPEVGSN